MAHFDRSKWYQISTPNGLLSIVGTPTTTIDNKTSVQPFGPVFLRLSNATDHEQQWQIYNTNSTHAVLRTRASGPNNYLSAAIAESDDGEVTAGSTKPIMGNYTMLDESMYWSIGAWSDRLFWFENARNGSGWHLNATGAFFLMSLNITAPQIGQQFKFTTLEDVEDEKYSTYSVNSWRGCDGNGDGFFDGQCADFYDYVFVAAIIQWFVNRCESGDWGRCWWSVSAWVCFGDALVR
ncbi:hypothetical protein SLS58_007800 [Diplodia intermedia]|uniref:Uncharacterized protein n=1 Tax=Diplodia intermedia TaxID=856260 RepID=A0ABR3TJ98_9PEZI